MRTEIKSAVAGVAAGAVLSGLMAFGRRADLLDKTLAENAEDWLDRTLDSRRRIGAAGTTAAEQVNHLAASAIFGAAYGVLRQSLPEVSPVVLGPLYGGALYAVNIVGIAPLIGLTRGEGQEPVRTRLQRLGIHLLFGIVLGTFAELGKGRK